MRIPRIHTPHPLQVGQHLALEPASAHYLSRVLRMQPGRELVVFNGAGGEYQGVLTEIGKKTAEVRLDSFVPDNRESPLTLELAIGVSRGERMDWVIQKATELGVTHIQPLMTERTEVKLSAERADKKQAHWQQVIISACEQCQRSRLPALAQPRKIGDWLPDAQGDLRFVLHHRDSRSLPADARPGAVTLLIGPEGGLSDGEIDAARAAQFSALTLGPRVLRTETAPVAAISLAQYLWGDWG
ncbi:16S rRNA (uracil(1498)-N(3))-methyltransferase [Marinimicrobium alkaliphilum]|uniref:16S rRNA (uracil(1498)-N(3))-methyltransferase n=1 Tax=Marinimicrobium alkaliphilum TaxID=2202654 RepID=UPI000DB9B469|nr:16S rRNA (uracil(1498)-N(3))-methyltransferase [Marinimicrobium alkaliphilum]